MGSNMITGIPLRSLGWRRLRNLGTNEDIIFFTPFTLYSMSLKIFDLAAEGTVPGACSDVSSIKCHFVEYNGIDFAKMVRMSQRQTQQWNEKQTIE